MLFNGKVIRFKKCSILAYKHKTKAHELWLVGGVPSPLGRVREGADKAWRVDSDEK